MNWFRTYFSPLIKWQEPKDYVKKRNQEAARAFLWWHRLLVVIGTALFILPTWGLAHLKPSKDPPPFWVACLLSLALGALFAYVIPWIIQLCPREVRLFRKSIFSSQGNSHRHAALKQVREIVFKSHGKYFLAVVMMEKNANRNPMKLCLPNPETAQALIKHLAKLGVKTRLDDVNLNEHTPLNGEL